MQCTPMKKVVSTIYRSVRRVGYFFMDYLDRIYDHVPFSEQQNKSLPREPFQKQQKETKDKYDPLEDRLK